MKKYGLLAVCVTVLAAFVLTTNACAAEDKNPAPLKSAAVKDEPVIKSAPPKKAPAAVKNAPLAPLKNAPAKNDPLRKLGRGAINLTTGWFELFVQTLKGQDKATELFIGFFRGVGYAFGRTLAGAYEVVTFPIPMPANYESIIKPDTIFKN